MQDIAFAALAAKKVAEAGGNITDLQDLVDEYAKAPDEVAALNLLGISK